MANIEIGRRIFMSGALATLVATGRARAADAPASAPAPTIVPIQAEVEHIVARFMIRAKAFLPGVKAPKVVISFTPQLSWIEDDGSAIHTVAWSQCPPDMQGFFAQILGKTPPMPPAQFFHDVFNTFLVPHEMSHFVDARRGHLKNGGNFYGGEVRANRIAVAFWLKEKHGRARMEKLMNAVAVAESNLPSPVPAGQDKVAYFNANYLDLLNDPSKYGWYQFRMFLDAWDQRDTSDFDKLLSEA